MDAHNCRNIFIINANIYVIKCDNFKAVHSKTTAQKRMLSVTEINWHSQERKFYFKMRYNRKIRYTGCLGVLLTLAWVKY